MANDERGGDDFATRLAFRRLLDGLVDELEGAAPELVDVDVHGGQRRRDVAADADVVEAADRHVAGAIESGAAQLRERADGHGVVRGEDRRRPRILGDQRSRRGASRILGEVAAALETAVASAAAT